MPRSAASAVPRAVHSASARSALACRLIKILTGLPGLLLVIVSILFVFGLVNALLNNQQLLFQAVIAGLMLAFLWYLYMHLPHFCGDSFPDYFIDPNETTMAFKLPKSYRIKRPHSSPNTR